MCSRCQASRRAEVFEYGRDFNTASAGCGIGKSQRLACCPALHPDLIRGVATDALELLQAVASLHRDLLDLDTEIIGVVTRAVDADAQSFKQRRIVCTETADTFADGMACTMPVPEAFEIIRKGAARIVPVETPLLRRTKTPTQPGQRRQRRRAGSGMQERERNRSERIGVVLSGANIDQQLSAEILAG